MEIKFNKTVLPYQQSVVRQVQLQEQSQQIRLAESMPDVEQVLSCWGQVILRGKQWERDCVQVSGGVAARVLYIPKACNRPQCIETWIPFQISVDIADNSTDGAITAWPFLRSLEARVLSDRKLLILATVGVTVDASVTSEVYLYLTDPSTYGVEMLCNNYPMQLPVETGEKHFEVEEPLNITVPGEELTVLRETMDIVLSESKIISDKLVIRGNAILDILYMDSNGYIRNWNTEIPLSQYAQLSTEYDPGAYAEICFAVTDLELDNRENSGIYVKAGLLAQYTVYDNKDITIIEDAYCNNKRLEISSELLQLPSILEHTEAIVQPEADLDLPGHEILDVMLFIEELHSDFEDSILCVEPRGIFQILSQDPEGNLHRTVRRWGTSWRLDASPDVTADMSVTIEGMPKVVGQKVVVPLKLKLNCGNTHPINMITEMQLGDPVPADPNRPSLILCRTGKQSLWELAKSTGSTVDAIKKANDITNEPVAETLLLIPVN